MGFVPHILFWITFGFNLATGQLASHAKSYSTAPFSPTGCTASEPISTSNGTCSLSNLGLPNNSSKTITYSTSTTVTTTLKTPNPTFDWQIVLNSDIAYQFPQSRITDNVKVYDIDLDSSPDTFASYHASKKFNDDLYLICYFSAGTSEKGRQDYPCFNIYPGEGDIGCNYGQGSRDESWLNTTSEAVRAIMIARLDTAKRKGCDAIDPDNTDGYTPDNHSGIGETQTDAEDYVRFLAQEAHNRGLAIGLKNSEDMVPNLVNIVDFAVVEECFKAVNDENQIENACPKWSPFYGNSTPPKPVYNIEYPVGPDGLKPLDRWPWTAQEAANRCLEWDAYWANRTGKQYLKTALKNYYLVDCGIARCGGGPPAPALVSSSADFTTTVVTGRPAKASPTVYHTTSALLVPLGCSQKPLPTSAPLDTGGDGDRNSKFTTLS